MVLCWSVGIQLPAQWRAPANKNWQARNTGSNINTGRKMLLAWESREASQGLEDLKREKNLEGN